MYKYMQIYINILYITTNLYVNIRNGLCSEGELEIFVVYPDQEYHKQDEEDQKLHEALPFFAVVRLVHSAAKKHQICLIYNPLPRYTYQLLRARTDWKLISLHTNQPASSNESEDSSLNTGLPLHLGI